MSSCSSEDDDDDDNGCGGGFPHVLRVHVHAARALRATASGVALLFPREELCVRALLGDAERETAASAAVAADGGTLPYVVWEGDPVLEFDYDGASPEVLSLQVWALRALGGDDVRGRCTLLLGPLKDELLRHRSRGGAAHDDGGGVEREEDGGSGEGSGARAWGSVAAAAPAAAAVAASSSPARPAWHQLEPAGELRLAVQLLPAPWRQREQEQLRRAAAIEAAAEEAGGGAQLLSGLRRLSEGVGQAGTRLSALLMSPTATAQAPPAPPTRARAPSAWTCKVRLCSASDLPDAGGIPSILLPAQQHHHGTCVVAKAAEQQHRSGTALAGDADCPEWPAARCNFFAFEFDDDMPLKLKLKFTVLREGSFQETVLGQCAVDIARLRADVVAASPAAEALRSFELGPSGGQLHCMVMVEKGGR